MVEVKRAGDGIDEFLSGRGNDLLILGGSRDTVVLERRDGRDTVRNFEDGEDKIDLTDFGFNSFIDVKQLAANVGDDLVVDFGTGEQLIIEGLMRADFNNSDVLI